MCQSPFPQQVIAVLRIMLADASQRCEHMENIQEFEWLFEDAKSMLESEVISPSEFMRLETLHNELYEMSGHPDPFNMFSDKQFPIAPDWEPTRMAARDALREFEREHS